MKSKELMIGDWVISKKRGKDEILEVVTIDGGSDTVWLDGDSYSGVVKGDDISPIPLTTEILEKNGFVYNDMPFVQVWEQFGLSIFDNRIICGQNVSMEVEYVHQLQHALRLCGLDDFADNFVIKEGGER